ncbi:uncharacterized protein KY384_004307 [Bacidia gigantensis]|uniref:uncharacterized protein n=1 Tax=Bacidia gigantensis TaxID=2732470 RepID=UPI001D0364E1|nr:uncharacterized protein KY384_004307 [Bacidia gigantensis]KAG8530950.1 hypothetical protein KY384_004307 [Bacidia gigantensis]
MEMSNLQPSSSTDKGAAQRVDTRYTDDPERTRSSDLSRADTSGTEGETAPINGAAEYRVYKVRWFGLIQLVLLNVIVSWDWLTFSPVANTAADFYGTNPSIINWLSTAFLFAFVAASPWTIFALHRGGPRLAIITSSILILIGNWIRYGGTRTRVPSFGLTMFGQILIGLAQPFVLSAPTYYSELWFSPRGRVSATAIASLANPFGGALGQLIDPFLANKPSEIPSMTLYVAIISTVATIPSFFVPAKPRTPVSPSSTQRAPDIRSALRLLSTNPTFWLIAIPFWIYVGFFNSISSLLTQIMTPYKFSETDSGIAGALLILVGLVAAAITSPIIDRTKAYVPLIRTLVPIIALSYLAFIWAPGTRSVAAPFVILSVLGAACFSLVPVALEFLVEVNYPVGPEATSTICWTGGQLFGGIFILISDALKAGKEADPAFNMGKALIFQATCALAVVPCVLLLGRLGAISSKRLHVDKGTGPPSTTIDTG